MNYFGSAPPTLNLFPPHYIISKQLLKRKNIYIVHIYDITGINVLGKLKLFTCFSILISYNILTPIPLLPSCPVY